MITGGLRGGGLAPACGSAHMPVRQVVHGAERDRVEATNYCPGVRCGIILLNQFIVSIFSSLFSSFFFLLFYGLACFVVFSYPVR